MTWQYWITLYIQTHCAARGLRSTTMAAYRATLYQFRGYIEAQFDKTDPAAITAAEVLTYLEFLRSQRNNGGSAVNRQLVILRNFYKAIVAMGHLAPDDNPLAHFPKIKATPLKLPVILSEEEIIQLLDAPPDDTVLGLRDRALLAVLYGTGIRASECVGLREQDFDVKERTITVTGKGGHQRTLPLNDKVQEVLMAYRAARGLVSRESAVFQSRLGKGMSRGAIYERVRTWAQRAKIHKTVSPHRLRHTFATHLLRADTPLVTIRDLLGHRMISSTQIYLHVTAHDLRKAADIHPISRLAPMLAELLPGKRLPKQRAPWLRQAPG